MSLLIKALDKAMTDKAATDKTSASDKQVENQPLELSLESISPVEPESAKEVSREISLEEEAGLSIAPNKYSKSKAVEKSAKTAHLEKSSVAKSASFDNQPSTSKPVYTGASSRSADAGFEQNTLPPVFQTMATQADNINQKAAAKAFVANQHSKTGSSKMALALLGLAGALVIWLAIQGYAYFKILMMPDVVVVKPVVSVTPQDLNEINAQPPVVEAEQTGNTQSETIETEDLNPVAIAAEMPMSTSANSLNEAQPKSIESRRNAEVIESDDAMTSPELPLKNNSQNKRANKRQDSSQRTARRDSPIQLTSKTPANGVDPNLSAAYAAFNNGDDALAQQKYRQVLQGDVRNTDALLGMAAIAQRQNRNADAAGWYQKVLEIEPRNSLAQSAMVNAQMNTDTIGRESRLKNMIAQQPEAHLYAALGNGYAEQNQWPSAQDAYFNASRLSPNNADYAFNLAISLEQLGKANLALAQYQRALELLNKSGAGSPNKAILEARIQALQ